MQGGQDAGIVILVSDTDDSKKIHYKEKREREEQILELAQSVGAKVYAIPVTVPLPDWDHEAHEFLKNTNEINVTFLNMLSAGTGGEKFPIHLRYNPSRIRVQTELLEEHAKSKQNDLALHPYEYDERDRKEAERVILDILDLRDRHERLAREHDVFAQKHDNFSGKIAEVFERIAEDVRNSYVVTFQSASTDAGRLHDVVVVANGERLRERTGRERADYHRKGGRCSYGCGVGDCMLRDRVPPDLDSSVREWRLCGGVRRWSWPRPGCLVDQDAVTVARFEVLDRLAEVARRATDQRRDPKP